jgi:dienelactone hydrolase
VLADASPSVIISGLRSGEVLRVAATSRRLQNFWSASASFRADRDGTVVLARDAPIDRAYSGTAALGLLGVQTPGRAISPRAGSSVVSTFTATAGGRSSSAVLRQLQRAPDVRVRAETMAHQGFYGRLYLPPGHAPGPGVVVWGGSEGGIATGNEWAQLIASHGIPALGLAYFDAPGLPCALSDIPLEYFARAVRWMGRRSDVNPHRVWLLSVSRGSEAEALLAAHFPALVHGFVGAAPSSTAYGSVAGACRPHSRAAWTLHGEPVPFSVVGSGLSAQGRYDSRQAFAATMHTARTRRARIPIGHFRGPVLLLAGSDDQLWPSPIYSAQMMRELHDDPATHQRHVYRGAGHYVLDPPSLPSPTTNARGLSVGGTEAADDAAHRADWPLMLHFIKSH